MANFLKKAVQKVTNTVLDNRMDAAEKEVAKAVGTTQAAAMRTSIVKAMTKPGSDLAKKLNEVNNVGTAAVAVAAVGLAAVGAGAAGIGAGAGATSGGGAAAAGGGGVVKAVGGASAIGAAAKPIIASSPGAKPGSTSIPTVSQFETKPKVMIEASPGNGAKPGTSVVQPIQKIPISTLPVNKPVGLLNTIETASDKINQVGQTYVGQAVKSIAGSALQGFMKPKVTKQTEAVNQVAQALSFQPQAMGGSTLNDIANAIGNGAATNAAFGVGVTVTDPDKETFWEKYKWAIGAGVFFLMFPIGFFILAMTRRRR
jgi:hypothetical protein